ncbi:MAG: rRNA maturation RNase YbeY [Solirubrobacterales bacterium]|nr:rRNA maturation RNase YbeY [Solirubrobacterales bacterium]MCB8915616.1 rRNA maturation RNase YbeY [Thermoleophilales bacterium]
MSIDLDDVPARFQPAVAATLESVAVKEGHLAIEVVNEFRIRELNREHRGRDKPTDVLSFPVDEERGPGPFEMGDVFICPDYCVSEVEAVVHGVLHLCGFDHETDQGEMLDLQDRIVTGLGIEPKMTTEVDGG